MKKYKSKSPENIDGSAEYGTCYHCCVMNGYARIQINAGDTVYLNSIREMRKIAKFINKAADYLRDNK